VAVAAVAAVTVLMALTAARPSGRALPVHEADPANGEVIYHIGGCISCHKASGASGIAGLPSGGAPFETPVGTFWPGNLTPDSETGLESWTAEQFVDAMTRGISPDRRHYFPAFPYTSYRQMRVEDVLDLWAYLNQLEPVTSPGRAAEIPLSWLARRGVGLWKRIALDETGFRSDPAQSDAWNRGAYLVNGPGHCGECHTPRNSLMIPDVSLAYAGGPHPRGDEGMVPSLLDLEERGRYSGVPDLVLALQFGETLGYDKLSSGGMADIQMNLAMLPEDDLNAIAEYLLSLP
jgi:mono/diheme cytochrome c family protein